MLLKVVCDSVTSHEQKYGCSLQIHGAWWVIKSSGILLEGRVFYVKNTKKIYYRFYLGNLNGGDYLVNLRKDDRIMLKRILDKWGMRLWIGFNFFRTT